MNVETLTWGAPAWFWTLAFLPLAAALYAWGERRRGQLLGALVASRLQAALAGSVSLCKRRVRFALTLGALACFAAALAQPRYGFTWEEAKRKGRDVLIAVDVSRSMLATDVSPNRLDRAKFAAQDLLKALEGDRVGLIAFAGSAFLQAPLTVDDSAVLASLNELDTGIIPLGGTNLAEAIRVALDGFGKGESDQRALIFFTDGEDLGSGVLDAARKAAGKVRIFPVGIGSANGALIPVPGENGGTEFVKGPDGQFVKSRLDEATLTALAEATGGFYTRLQNGPADMRHLVEAGLGKMKEGAFDARMSQRPIERYQWPLGLGIALLIFSLLLNERRRGAGVFPLALAALCLAGASPAQAAPGGEELYNQGRYKEALQQFEEGLKRRPGLPELEFNKGTADFALGDLEAAATAFGKALAVTDPQRRAKVEQNLGTTLLKRAFGRDETQQSREREADLKNAVQHLGEALKLEPGNRAAQTNLQIARKELAKPKPTPPPQQKDQQDRQKDNQRDNQDQQSKDQQSKDQQSKDQQSKDQQSKDQQSKDQQSKDQQSKDQQSKDQQSKDQQSKDQQSKDQQSKDQQSKDQQSKDQQSKDQQSKDQQSKDQQSKDQQSKDQQSKDQQSKNQQAGQRPSPAPKPEDEKKLSGEIKANDSQPGKEQGEPAEAQAEPGQMSPAQARALLDSLKGDEEHPFKPEQRSAAPVLKDW
ncbi:MAG: VWA domain-containing protein [Chthoniobacteraceae bacterium]|nr:VWA domain-containing protein [Chthoniobacteraceae bacterium]